jgi:hypothetical protein
MIDKTQKVVAPPLPLLFRFAEPLPSCDAVPLRYDPARQISQVLIDGIWLDAPASAVNLDAGTRITATNQETTDDS